MTVLTSRELPIANEDDVVLVRRWVQQAARRRGFDTFTVAAITTATSELTRNALVHGGGGRAVIEEVERDGRLGLRATFTDAGPGIPDPELAMTGGWSSRRSLGLGLSGSQRLVDEFDLQTGSGGTTVTVAKWARPSYR